MMKITLWSEHARAFNISNIYDSEAGNVIVCLVVGCVPREDIKNNGNLSSTFETKGHRHMPIYHSKPAYFFILKIVRLWPLADKPCLTGSSACCYYLNPNIPEARPFYSRYSLRRPDPICN